ncbi:hypothetical protein [Sulfurimonas sp.]|uniref:hypothetical protein n=1 Tax=Sulfurimonas sp. TaxID=2022749 RepID=UPI003D14F731
MSSKKFIAFVGVFAFLIVGFVGGVNYVVDPGYIYFKKKSNISPDEYAEELISSESGLIADGWNERAIKTSLAKFSGNYDCIVMGSSHIMQISGIRNTGNILDTCPKVLNLGVSGGSFEDLFVFSNIIFSNNKKPKTIFIDVSPWLFKFNMDTRYKMNMKHYNEFLIRINDDKISNTTNDYELNLFKNLFNLEYFITSLKNLKSITDKSKIEKPINKFTFENGYIQPLKLQDGSHLYASNFIEKSKNDIENIKNGGGDYKIENNIYEKYALELFEKLIQYYQKNNIKVNFIITPYHPSVFKDGEIKPVAHMKEVENMAKEIASKYNINLYGSFFPENIGCKENEFFDFMHATTECLNKIEFNK